MVDPTGATDVVLKFSQYGLAGVCVLLVAVVAYCFKTMASVMGKSNTAILKQIEQSTSAQQSLKDVVSNNTEITKKCVETIEKSSRMTCDSIVVLHDLQIAIAACPKK